MVYNAYRGTLGFADHDVEYRLPPASISVSDLSERRLDETGSPETPPGLYPWHEVISIQDPNNTQHILTLFGGAHLTDPNNPLLQPLVYELVEWMAETDPEHRLILSEGTGRQPRFYNHWDWMDHSVAAGMQQFFADLGKRYDIPVLPAAEAYHAEAHRVVEQLIAEGHSKKYAQEQVFLYYTSRYGPQVVRTKQQANVHAIMQEVIANLAYEWRKSGSAFDDFQAFTYADFLDLYSKNYSNDEGTPRSFIDDIHTKRV